MTQIKKLRKAQIIEATLGLVEEGGLKNLTTKNVAERVGISESSLYNIFKSKDELMLETLKFLNKRRIDQVLPLLESDFTSIDEVVDGISGIMIEMSSDKYCYSDLSISADRALVGDKKAMTFLESACHEDLSRVDSFLEKIEEKGLISLEGISVASYALLILIIGHIYYNLMFQDRSRNNDRLKEIIHLFFEHMKPEVADDKS